MEALSHFRWLPPVKGVTWSQERCPKCGARVVVGLGGVVIWCEHYRGWKGGLDGGAPDSGVVCDYVLASG